AAELVQEFRFRKLALQLDVSGDVFQQQRPAATLNQLKRVIGHELDGFVRRADRVQVAKVGFRRASKRDVFADPFGANRGGDFGELSQPLAVERAWRTEAEAQAVDETTQRGSLLLAPIDEMLQALRRAVKMFSRQFKAADGSRTPRQ